MHRLAVLTLNGGFKDFIITYLAVFAPRLHCAKRTGSVLEHPQRTKTAQLEPPLPGHTRLAASGGSTHATGMAKPAQSHRSLNKSTMHIFLSSKTNAKYSKFSASVPCRF